MENKITKGTLTFSMIEIILGSIGSILFFYEHGRITPIQYWHLDYYFLIFVFLFLVVQIVFFARPSVKREFKKKS